MKKVCLRKKLAAAVALATAVLLTGCGSASGSSSFDNKSMATDTAASYDVVTNPQAAGGTAYATEEAMEESGSMGGELLSDRKLIKTVELEVETREFELMMSELESQVQKLGGYIENLETYNGSSYSNYRSTRWASLTIRIPKDELNGFLNNVSDIGNVTRRSDSVEDVTLSYVDMESRRNTLRTEQERLLEFMEQAETIEDVIALEERLSNVRYQLESMESQLRAMDNQVEYSTVYLNVSEVKELTPVEEKSDWQRVTEGFAGSLRAIGYDVKEAAIWFVINIPYLVIWAAVIAVAVVMIKKRRKKKAAKRAAKSEAAKQEVENSEIV